MFELLEIFLDKKQVSGRLFANKEIPNMGQVHKGLFDELPYWGTI